MVSKSIYYEFGHNVSRSILDLAESWDESTHQFAFRFSKFDII